jgi:c-di-AMP phosphodiesterase-like protein
MANCYMCGSTSTSVEHAPPKGFFPIGMRDQLITVPSCSLHNEDTSMDDEYVRNIITMSIENNQTSINHFLDKSFKSFKRNPALTSNIIGTLKEVSHKDLSAKSFQIDRPRFDRVIRKIAYALYFHEFGQSWERLLAVTTNQLRMSDMSNDHLGDIFDTLTEDLDSLVMKGNNQLVFQYSFIDFGDSSFDKALFMIFYEGFPFWIIPDKNSNHGDFD